jgi:hypothetical protein
MKVLSIIEIAGHPKEHVEEIMKRLIEKIRDERKVMKYNIFEAQEKDKLFHTFSEVEIEFNTFDELFGFCLDYLPTSIEFLNPQEIKIKREELENGVNDLLMKLQQDNMEIKRLKSQIIFKDKI